MKGLAQKKVEVCMTRHTRETRLCKHHHYSPWPPYLHEGPWPPPSITKPLKKITDRPMCIQLVPGLWRATPSSG
eukprot:jgi/Botrbrau1/13232/Bobra.0199s0005.1